MKNQEIQLDKLPSLKDLWCSQCLGYTQYDVNCTSWNSDSGGGSSTHYNCKECKGEMYSPEYSLTVMDDGIPNIAYFFVIIGLLGAYLSAGVNGLLGFAAFCILMFGIFKWSCMLVFNKYNIWANHVFAVYGNSYLKHITRKQFDDHILNHIQSRESKETS